MSKSRTSESRRLNLEQQRKRAKDLLRAQRRRAPDAAERIARHLPRAGGLSEAALFELPLSLGEAQLVVAREAGFPSWPRLKHALELAELGREALLEALLDAVLAGNSAAVSAALSSEPGAARSSLHVAAALGDTEAALELLDESPARVHERAGVRQWSPLFYLCSARLGRSQADSGARRARIAARLLELGAEPNEEIESDGSPGGFRSVLQAAAGDAASEGLVELLLGASAVLTPTGGAAGHLLPLTNAVGGGNIACVRRLLAADPPGWMMREAIELAIEHDRPDLCKLLLEHGANPNFAGRWWGQHGSCLHAAILLGRGKELIEVLLASDVDVQVTDRDGRTPYALAVRTGHTVAGELLRERGATDAELDGVDRLIAACVAGDAEGARALLGADPALRTRYRRTDHQVLCWGVRNRRYPAIPLLLECGLDPNVADDHGETPLHLAAAAGHSATISSLERAGASKSARNFLGRTPFDEGATDRDVSERASFETAVDAVVTGDIEKLRALLDDNPDLAELLERGADVNALAHNYGGGPGQTTLGLTVTSVFPEQAGLVADIVRVLIRAGANVDGLDGQGDPLMGAIGEGRRLAASALIAAGARVPNLRCAAAVGWLDLIERYWPEARAAERVGALIDASRFDQSSAIDALLARGVAIDASDEQKFTPLHWAALCANLAATELLLARGAPLELRSVYGGTVLGTAVYACCHDNLGRDSAPVVERLCAAGARIDAIGGSLTGKPAVDEVLLRYGFVPSG